MDMIFLVIVLCTSTSGLSGFLIGKYSERVWWNELIKEGKLPKPVNCPRKY